MFSVGTFVHDWDGAIKTQHLLACSIVKYCNLTTQQHSNVAQIYPEFLQSHNSSK